MDGNKGMGFERIKDGVVKRVKKEDVTIESEKTEKQDLGEAGHGKYKIKITPEEQMIASPYTDKGEKEQKENQGIYKKLLEEVEKKQKDKLKEGYVSPEARLNDLFKN